jgi:signal transduction histidine kinase
MRTAGVLPDGDPRGRAELVHESARTRVTRHFLAGRTVVRKEPRGPDADSRLRHERALLERVRGVRGVAQLLDSPQYPGSVVLADAGDTSLAALTRPLAVDTLLGLAVDVARAVAGMHRRGVLHGDITPANIVVSRDGSPCLVDFALATAFAEIRPEFTHPSEIVGALEYLAPERTGRTGRSVDQRADLYALGATLYELATGSPPFGSGDLLRLTHDHLARVPTSPSDVNPAVPAPLSQMVLHLLEKEPDRRYQSAEGLVHDLERLRARPAPAAWRVGEHDVPLRLRPPSRLVGRAAEVAALEAAFAEAMSGECRAVLVGGGSGVGKTALVDGLRAVVAGADGWFVAGKFDQYRQDVDVDAGFQAFRALGRLLLAEPEDELTEVRDRILAAVGPNVGLLSVVVPEFAALLAVPPDPGDPSTAEIRVQRASVQVLRAVASPKRPVVVFLDDLQWAGRTPLGFLDLLLGEEPVEGLLLVGTYRDAEVDAAHPLAAPLARWRDRSGVRRIHLDDLSEPDLAAMLAEMLHADPPAATTLAAAIAPHTAGNPYETLELLDALRGEEVLIATGAGWRWDAATVRARLERSEAPGPPAARVEAMPAASREMVEAMACLGGRVELGLLQAASGKPAGVVDQRLAPALDEGVLVLEPAARPAVRFRHDRIREAVLHGLDPPRRRTLQLAVARRLAGVPELSAVAAEEYVPVIDAVDDPGERVTVVGLLRRAADQAAQTGDYASVNALLSAALRLIDPGETATLVEVHVGRHAALFGLGRLDEADAEYAAIEELSPGVVQRAGPTAVQVHSLSNRKRGAEAIALGLESVRACGVVVPPVDRIGQQLDRQFDHLYRWLDTDAAGDLTRPELTDPALLAATRLFDTVLPAAYFAADHATPAWLSLEALRIWREHGPGPTLVGPACIAAFLAVTERGDHGAGYRASRRILEWAEARRYEPGTSRARHMFSLLSCWSDPIEDGVREAQRSRQGLIAGGDFANAGYSYVATVRAMADSAPTLESLVLEVDKGLAFVRRSGNEQTAQVLDTYRWLTAVLRGDSPAGGGNPVPVDRYADNPLALLHAHLTRALAAAVLGDPTGLARHSAAAMPLLPVAAGFYSIAVLRVLRGLALAGQAHAADGTERAALLTELDEVTRWLAERSADAPANFLHLLRFLEAERAWAEGDVRGAELAFDAARREVAGLQRPWHRALITERAARFSLSRGLDHAGHELLAQARAEYAAWGADAKVAQLDWAYPTLQPHAVAGGEAGEHPADPAQPRGRVTTGTLDLLGILSASQALSSETTVERLHARVVEVLSAMTGATGVHLVLWDDDRHDWHVPAPDGGTAPAGGGADAAAVPLSVLRYAQRLGEPLVVADATEDDRFARDPYVADLDRCSLLAVPVLSSGVLQAVLLLENRLIRGAFSTERLDVVRLIAGQLAVSLTNARLYAELTSSRARIVTTADQERRRLERDLHDGAQQRLVSLSMQLRAAQAAPAPELAERLDGLAAEVKGALEELREIAHGIHPAALAGGGLRPALKTLARRSAVPVRLRIGVGGRLPEAIESAAYYVVAETLTNAAKHAGATVVDVEVDGEVDGSDGLLRIAVRDDGRGGADFAGGSGLIGLKDRVEALGGRIELHSPPAAGTTVRIALPLPVARPAGTAL